MLACAAPLRQFERYNVFKRRLERERERERANFVAKKGEGELVAADDVKLKKDVISFH